DLNNGTYQTGLSVAADIPNDNTPVAVNYVIVNNGHSGKDVVERALQTAVAAPGDEAVKVASGATKGGTESAILGAALGISPVPLGGTAIAVLSAWVVGKIGTLLFADCDGTVAAGIRIYTGSQIIQKTTGGQKLTETVHHPGTDSPTGCGSNSSYFTT